MNESVAILIEAWLFYAVFQISVVNKSKLNGKINEHFAEFYLRSQSSGGEKLNAHKT